MLDGNENSDQTANFRKEENCDSLEYFQFGKCIDGTNKELRKQCQNNLSELKYHYPINSDNVFLSEIENVERGFQNISLNNTSVVSSPPIYQRRDIDNLISKDLLNKLEESSPVKGPLTKIQDTSFSLELNPASPQRLSPYKHPHSYINENYSNCNQRSNNININYINIMSNKEHHQNNPYYNDDCFRLDSTVNEAFNQSQQQKYYFNNYHQNEFNSTNYSKHVYQTKINPVLMKKYLKNNDSNPQYMGNFNIPNNSYLNKNTIGPEEEEELRRMHSLNISNSISSTNSQTSNLNVDKRKSINSSTSFNKIFSGKNGWFCCACKNFNFESKINCHVI